jgi:hypothetical protein
MGTDKKKVTVTLDLTEVRPDIRNSLCAMLNTMGLSDVIDLLGREAAEPPLPGESPEGRSASASALLVAQKALFNFVTELSTARKG